MEPRISIITLGVKDLARSYEFYARGLGFPTSRTPDQEIIFFQTRGTCLALYPLYKLAEDVGAKLEKPPQDVFWGGYSGYFSDPDGYLWEVAYGAFEFNEDGSLIVT